MSKKNYLTLIWERGKSDNREYYHKDRRGWIYNIGSAVIIAIITPIVSYFLGQITMPSQLGYAILAGVIAGAIVFVVWYMGVLAYHLYHAHENLYREEEEKAKLHTWRDVDFEIYYFESHEDLGVGVTIRSNKNISVILIGSANIVNILLGQNKYYVEQLSKTSRLPFIKYSENRPILDWNTEHVRSGSIPDHKFAISNWDDNRAWIYNQKEELSMETDREYILRVMMDGVIYNTGHSVLETYLIISLKYSKDEDGNMKVFSKIKERIDRA